MKQSDVVQAGLIGMSLDRFTTLTLLGLELDQFDLFEHFTDEDLKELKSYKLDLAELTEVVQREYYGPHNVLLHAKLRKRGVEAIELTGTQRPSQILVGLDAGLNMDLIRRTLDANLSMWNLIEAQSVGITADELFQLHAIRKYAVMEYTAAREAGYNHEQLIAVAREAQRLAPDFKGFSISEYLKVRSTGVTHDQVMQMLQDEHIDHHGRGYYFDYITGLDHIGLTHVQAYELAVLGVYPNHYWAASRGASHSDIMMALRNGMSAHTVTDFGSFLANNCRITAEEVMQYWLIEGMLSGINSYIKLLDAGFSFEEIRVAHEAGLGLWEIEVLRSEPWLLTQSEAIQVGSNGLRAAEYIGLREQGINHKAIIKQAKLVRV